MPLNLLDDLGIFAARPKATKQSALGLEDDLGIFDNTEFKAISDYIRTNEGVSNKVYTDTSGNKTVGVGHLLKKGEKVDDIETTFKTDVKGKIEIAKSLFPKFNEYPLKVKQSLVDGIFRGEYKKGQKTVDYINKGEWDKVPDEYINRQDYKASKTSKNATGVYKRMDRNANTFRDYAKSNTTRPQATANTNIASLLEDDLGIFQKPDNLKKTIVDVATGGLSAPFTRTDLGKQAGPALKKAGELYEKAETYPRKKVFGVKDFEPTAKATIPTIATMGIPPLTPFVKEEAEFRKALVGNVANLATSPIYWIMQSIPAIKSLVSAGKTMQAKAEVDVVFNRLKEAAVKQGNTISQAEEKAGTLLKELLSKERTIPPEIYSKIRGEAFGKTFGISGEAGKAMLPNKDELINKILQIAPTTEKTALSAMALPELQKIAQGLGIKPAEKVPTEGAEVAKTPIVTDPARIQEIKNSIAEGEILLKYGKTTSGRKMTSGELDIVRRSIENAKAKIGKTPIIEPKQPLSPKSLAGIVRAKGGLSSKSLSKDYSLKELYQSGLGGVISKQGISPDDLAATLQEEGYLKVPENMNPGDYLIEQLKTKSKLPQARADSYYLKEQSKYLTSQKSQLAKEAQDIDFDPVRYEAEIQKALDTELKRIMKEASRPSALTPGQTKPVVHRATGYTKIEDIINIEESTLLNLKLQAEKKGSEEGFVAGKEWGKERMSQIRYKRDLRERVRKALRRIYKDPRHPEQALDFYAMKEIERLRDSAEISKTSPLGSMTIDELEGIAEQIKALRSLGRAILEAKKSAQRIAFEQNRANLISTMGGLPPQRPITAETSKEPLGRSLISMQSRVLRPTRIFDLLDRQKEYKGPHNQYFYLSADKAMDKQITGSLERKQRLLQIFEDRNMSLSWAHQVKNIAGHKLTNQEIVYIYYALQNPEQEAAVRFGNKLPLEVMQKAADSLTASEKSLANKIQELIGERYDDLRKTMIEIYNKDLGKVEKYFPLARLREYGSYLEEFDEEAILRDYYNRKGVEKGFTQSRIDIKPEYQQPVNMNAIDIAMKSIDNQEHFLAFAPLQRKLVRMINDPAYKQALAGKLGRGGARVIEKWINNVINPRSVYNSTEALATILRHNVAVAYLAFNVLTMSKQFPSITFALQEASPLDIANAMKDTMTDYVNTKAFVYGKDPQVRARAIERDIEELLSGPAKNAYIATRNKIGEIGFKGIWAVDHVVVLSIWKAVYNNAIRRGLSEPEAASLAHTVFLNVQEQAAVKDLPDIYRSGEFLKAVTMFTNQLNQIYNMLTYDIPYYAKSKPRRTMATLMSILLSSYLLAVTARGGKPPKDKKELSKDLTENAIQSIPIIGSIVSSGMSGFSGSVPVLQVFEDIAGIFTAKKPATRARRLFKAATVISGLPYSAPKRLIEGTIDLMTGKTKDLRRLIYSKYALGEKGKSGGKINPLLPSPRGESSQSAPVNPLLP